jgi:hypothetical protein
MANLTRYEQHAVREIELFKNPGQTWFTAAWDKREQASRVAR